MSVKTYSILLISLPWLAILRLVVETKVPQWVAVIVVVVDRPLLMGNRLYYTHCEKSRHTRETCWDLVGKPGDFRNAIASPQNLIDGVLIVVIKDKLWVKMNHKT